PEHRASIAGAVRRAPSRVDAGLGSESRGLTTSRASLIPPGQCCLSYFTLTSRTPMPTFTCFPAQSLLCRSSASILLIAVASSCGNAATGPSGPIGFLAGTASNHEIGIVVNSTGKALTMFQLGSPTTQQQIPLGASSTVTPVGFSLRNRTAAVPLGNAASVA